ncbi:transposase, partial [Streptococcus anginosus]
MAFLEQGNTFSDTVVNSRLESVNSFLKEVDSLIDFNKLKPILKKNSIGTKNSCGVKAYDPLLMFKIVLLQKFYNLSDVRVENELKVNLLYIKFVGLSLEDATPDSTTIGRFRNSLINNNIYDELFDEVNKQLSIKGFIANSGKDVLVDATLVK